MRQLLAAFLAASLLTVLAAGSALAAPTQVSIRIEGRAETLFEGPVAVEPHGVRASSDTATRPCDGINPNLPENVAPAPSPTAAGAEAMALVGESFDAQWYPSFQDYFLTRWGPDEQDVIAGAYWGVLVNNTFTNVGGCQYQLDAGDEPLWVYDAFQGRTTLALFPEAAGYGSGPRPLTVTGVAPGAPVPLEVVSYADDPENNPPPSPTRAGSSPYEGARVSPVSTGADGSERVEVGGGVTTDAQGKASVSYTEPGWHRVKATVGSPGAESVIRSNRLDVCVSGSGGATLEGAGSCAELPAADRVRGLPADDGEDGTTGTADDRPPAPGGVAAPAPPPTAPPALQLSVPRLDRRHLAHGRIALRWTVSNPGAGVSQWTVSSLTLGRKGARWVTRATGAEKSAATIRLPGGASYRLRFAITDRLGRTSTVSLGKVSVPEPEARRHQ